MSHIHKSNKGLGAIVVGCTLVFCYIWYSVNKPNAFQVNIGGRYTAYVKESSKFDNIYRSLRTDLKKQFGDVEIKDNITVERVKIDTKLLSEDSAIKQMLLDTSIKDVNAVEMRSAGKVMAVVANEEEGKLVLEYIKKYYISKCTIKDVKECTIKENITYSKVKTEFSKVELMESAAINIINANHASKTPLISVIIKGNVDANEPISPSTVIKWDARLESGKSNIISAGKDGIKLVQKMLTYENKRLISEKIIGEKVTLKKEDRVIVKGSMVKKEVSAQVFTTPSRGMVTSGFGLRWGKMHCGLDIGASSGSPILAAIDGVVSFAGWEEGYGNTISIKHAGNIETLYGHCSKLNVVVGQSVKKGEVIGAVGSTGNSTGPHLHFEVKVKGVAVNPIGYLK
jgi:murein DD-endopeptidase MepM/ murein hydrolase activator NlpD